MDDITNFSQNIDTVFSDIENFAKTDAVLGSPVSVGDKTLIPVMSVTLGYGSTPGKNSQGANQMVPNGVGLGARVNTNAVVVIDKDTVSMLPTNEKSNLGQLMNNIPPSILNSIPQSVLNAGQNILQKAMPQSNQTSQQSSGQNTQQSAGMNMSSNNNSMQNKSQSQQNNQQSSQQNNQQNKYQSYQNYQKKQ